MVDSYSALISGLDFQLARMAAALLLPLGLYVLLSGFDDLFLDLVWFTRRFRSPPLLPPHPSLIDERRIAIYVPCWREHEVIAHMVEQNLDSVLYDNFEIFIGVYANDDATRSAVRNLSNRFENVHLAEVPHDGPSSKADCLNWIHQAVLRFEEGCGAHYEAMILHDAEDLLHPEELLAVNRYAAEFDMIQVPVLPIPTPWREFTHGVYCDDFAEGQYKDLQSRVDLGGFLPGCGVGTAFRRSAMDLLASRDANRLFAPDCLTEDYENGYRVHSLGLRQVFVPLSAATGGFLATREYFPRTASAAIRQRSRWIIGNALQSWQRHGWGRWPQAYFFWRDRKGLWGNPISLVCNLLLLYGLVSWALSLAAGRPWLLHQFASVQPFLSWLLPVNLLLLAERLATRAWVVSRLYGWRFASGVPLRMLWANWINFRATLRALHTFARARLRREPLVWVKTDHLYPSRYVAAGRPRLGEVLVTSGYIEPDQLVHALASQPSGVRLGEYLVRQGLLSESQLFEALSLQQGLPHIDLRPSDIAAGVARLLPRRVAREYRVLPFKVHEGGLCVASPEPPTERVQTELRRLCRLEIRFHLITPEQFDDLARRLL